MYALNGAGLEASAASLPITVNLAGGSGIGTGTAALMVVGASVLCLLLGAVTALLVMRARHNQQAQRDKERAQEQKVLGALM